MSKLDTADWRFRLSGSYVPTRVPKVTKCTGCGGSGKRFRGFGVYDEDDDGTCTTCYGSGAGSQIDPLAPQPELSPGLVAYLQDGMSSLLANVPECYNVAPVKGLFDEA